MNILICNDDGVESVGILILKKVLDELGDVRVVAPSYERSTTGHTMTLNNPIRVKKVSEKIYSCDGYPADCAMVGINHIFKNEKIDLVVSGINNGANLGQDMYYSGTVAAAREATFQNIPAIAISLVVNFQDKVKELYFNTAASYLKEMIQSGICEKILPNTLININVPNLPSKDIKGVKLGEVGFRNYSGKIDARTDCRGRDYFWIGGNYQGFRNIPNSDCSIVDQKYISLTPLKIFNSLYDIEGGWDSYLSKFIVN